MAGIEKGEATLMLPPPFDRGGEAKQRRKSTGYEKAEDWPRRELVVEENFN